MGIKIKLIQRYSSKCETKEEIKAFNEFYDLEEARFIHEAKICNDYNIEEFMRNNF